MQTPWKLDRNLQIKEKIIAQISINFRSSTVRLRILTSVSGPSPMHPKGFSIGLGQVTFLNILHAGRLANREVEAKKFWKLKVKLHSILAQI